eukprot:s1146_g8.t1
MCLDAVWTPRQSVSGDIWREVITASGKFEFLDRVLPRLVKFDHKILIFAQMTSSLDLLEKLLQRLGLIFTRIDGSKSLRQRSLAIVAFTREAVPVMLLTTRAGGLGLNLQVADTVILFDSDWNPQADLQASDRAHRIGQTRHRHHQPRCQDLLPVLSRCNQQHHWSLHHPAVNQTHCNYLQTKEVILQCPFFKKLGTSVHRRLSGIVQCLKCEQDTVLFRQGDPPGNCYVILEGSVGILAKLVKPDEETHPDVDSREGTPRAGPPLRESRRSSEGPLSDALSDSSEDSLNLTNSFRKESESRRSSAARSDLNSSKEFPSRRSSLKGKNREAKDGRRQSYESSHFEDDATSRRTSIEWCDSKGSADLYDSIQEEQGTEGPPSRRSSQQSLRRCSTESRFSEREDSKKSLHEEDLHGSRRSSQQSLRRSSTESRFSERQERQERQDSKKLNREGRSGSKSSLSRSRSGLVINIPEESVSDQESTAQLSNKSSNESRRLQSHDQSEREPIIRSRTHEGFSWYHPKSRLGPQVVRLSRGQLFGELALLGDQPRAASARCLEDSQLLVISRQERGIWHDLADFDSLLKSDLGKQKDETTGFLRRHVPGMSDLPEQSRFGKPHASYYFKQQSVPKGFVFIKQGEKTSEPWSRTRQKMTSERFWVLRKGVVEFWHMDPGQVNAPDDSGVKSRPSSSATKRRGRQSTRGRRIALLVEGGLFSTVPTNDPEPFTVVAQSLCEVFCVSKSDFMRLPYRVICAVQDHLMAAAMWRLNRCIDGRTFLQPQKEVKEAAPVQETKRKVLAELLHCDVNAERRGTGWVRCNALQVWVRCIAMLHTRFLSCDDLYDLRLLQEGMKQKAATGAELRASSPTSPTTAGSPSPERRPQPPIRPSSAVAKFYKLKSSYVNIGLRRSDGTVRTVTRVTSASQLARRSKATDAKGVPRQSTEKGAGQSRPVKVIRLMTPTALDRALLERNGSKLEMERKVIRAGNFSQDAGPQNLLKDLVREARNSTPSGLRATNFNEVNRLLARSEEERLAFEELDREQFGFAPSKDCSVEEQLERAGRLTRGGEGRTYAKSARAVAESLVKRRRAKKDKKDGKVKGSDAKVTKVTKATKVAKVRRSA